MPIRRLICIAYWAFLTLLLLAPDPLALLGIERICTGPGSIGVHFSFFVVLAVVVMAAQLNLRSVVLLAILVAYAIATEALQWLVPGRTVELEDLIENLLGLGAGVAIWWIARRCFAHKLGS